MVVRLSMWVSISWTSKRTRLSGVARSRGVSVGSLVVRTRVLAKEGAEKVGERKVS